MTSSKTHPNKIKVATYAIALNEEKHVARWLASTAGSDIRVVMDTGSTDKTVELLEAAGVIVGHIKVVPWRFDTARQAALDLVPDDVDVCLVLDMDEVPEPNFYKKIQKQWVEGAHRGWIQIDTGFKWKVDRLHSRHGWKWKWPCHEVAMWQGKEGDYTFCDTTAVIKHEPDVTKSRGQYMTMLQNAVADEFKDDARMWTYLCREYYFNNEWDKVIETAEQALKFDGFDYELAAICRWSGDATKNLKMDATAWFDRGVTYCPDQGETWLGVAAEALRTHKWAKALDAAIKVIECPKQQHYLHEPTAWSWKAYAIAMDCAYNLGFLDEAIAFGNEASKAKGHEQERIARNLKFLKGLKANAPRTSN
jgi:glycosyltransferase involved in cell wall biosynthesis